jgi:hypothetical protein
MSNRDQHIKAVLATIEEVGGTVDEIIHGNHWKVYWSIRSHKFIYVAAGSSRSVRGTWKAASDIRRYARSAVA